MLAPAQANLLRRDWRVLRKLARPLATLLFEHTERLRTRTVPRDAAAVCQVLEAAVAQPEALETLDLAPLLGVPDERRPLLADVLVQTVAVGLGGSLRADSAAAWRALSQALAGVHRRESSLA